MSRVDSPMTPRSSGEFVERMRVLMEADKYHAVVDRRYPIDGIVEAYRYVETGQKTGVVFIDAAETGTAKQA